MGPASALAIGEEFVGPPAGAPPAGAGAASDLSPSLRRVRSGEAYSGLNAGVSKGFQGRSVLWKEKGGNIFVMAPLSGGGSGESPQVGLERAGSRTVIGGGDAIGEALRRPKVR